MTVNITDVNDEIYQQYKRILIKKGWKITKVNTEIFEEAIQNFIQDVVDK